MVRVNTQMFTSIFTANVHWLSTIQQLQSHQAGYLAQGSAF